MSRLGVLCSFSVAALLCGSTALYAVEYPAGDPQLLAGMESAAV